ncbi:MAG: phosphomannomutase/phosphoglucomutase [Bdellovibrionota bacterium]
MIMNPVIFREYDVRGVVGEHFDADFAYTLGRAYASLHFSVLQKKSPTIAIGQDARLSCPKLVEALAKGLQDSGFNVKLLGLVTSPMTYFATFFYKDIDGGIMVTGSHNPPEYNGFKISIGKNTLYGADILKLLEIIKSEKYIKGAGKIETLDIFPDYIDRYKKEFGDLSGLKIVLDCGNGAAGVIVRKLYEACGATATILFENPDGTFPNHHPDPTVEKNLVDLKKEVLKQKADVGIGFDGDADRIGVVDENGKMILGDELMVLISRAVIKDNPGAKIVGDVKCSHRLYEDVEKHGGKAIMWKTGHSLIKQKIKEEKAPFGGELSGHIFFNDRNYGYDDAPYAGLRVVEILKKAGKPFSHLLSDLPNAFFTPEIRIDTTEEKKYQIVEAIKKKYLDTKNATVLTIDGIRVQFSDSWFLARASNTQPVVVLRFEATSKEKLEVLKDEIEKIVNPLL